MWPQSPKYFTAWPSTESLPTLALNPRAITEKPQQATADKATKLMIKWNYKKNQFIQKKAEKKRNKEQKGKETDGKVDSSHPKITLNVNGTYIHCSKGRESGEISLKI